MINCLPTFCTLPPFAALTILSANFQSISCDSEINKMPIFFQIQNISSVRYNFNRNFPTKKFQCWNMTRPFSGGWGVGTQIHFQKTAPRQLEHWEEGGGQTGGFQFQPKSWNTCSSRSVKDTGNDLRNDFGGCTPLGLSFWNISLHFCPVSAINILEHFVLRAVRSHRSQRCSLSAHRTLPDAGTKNLEAQYSAGMHETYGPARRRRWGFAAGAAGRAESMNR